MDELCQNKVVWHKSCHLKFATSKLNREQLKRQRRNDESDVRRSKRQLVEKNAGECIFCSERGGDLHQVDHYFH